MARAFSMNTAGFMAGIRRSVDKAVKEFHVRVVGALEFIDGNIANLTPVHTGKVLRNYRWSVGAATDTTIYEALGTMPPGPTGEMQLGAEPRRDINRAAMEASFDAMKKDEPFQIYVLSNPVPEAAELEAGLLPTPSRNRSSGYFSMTQAQLKQIFG